MPFGLVKEEREVVSAIPPHCLGWGKEFFESLSILFTFVIRIVTVCFLISLMFPVVFLIRYLFFVPPILLSSCQMESETGRGSE